MDDKILTPIISAVSVLCGVIVSQLSTMTIAWIDRRHKRKVLLREKYETLSLNFLDSLELPQKLMGHGKHTEEVLSLTHQKHANHVRMLALLYFPELLPSVENYIQTYSDLCVVCFGLSDPSNHLSIGEQVLYSPEYIAASEPHHLAKEKLCNTIEKYASKYAIA